MANRTHRIPDEGEVYAGYMPAKRQITHVTIGSSTDADVVVGDLGVYKIVTVTEPIMIFGIWTQCATAFTGSVTLTLGDCGSAALFFDDTTMNVASTGAVLIRDTGTTVPIVYTTPYDIEGTIAGATVAAGLLNVYIEYALLAD